MQSQLNFDLSISPHVSTNSVNYLQNVKFDNDFSLKICYLNARSLLPKRDEIEIILANVNSIDLFIITETWLNQNKLKFFNIKNYSGVFYVDTMVMVVLLF